MKAAVLQNWKDMVMTDIEMPVPGPDEALIKVIYGGICGSDITVYNGNHPTAKVPVVLCHEILGTIEKLPDGYCGAFHIGERVLMNPVITCGTCGACKRNIGNVCDNLKLMGIHVNGGFEQYTKVNTAKLVHVAADLPNTVAALGEPFAVGYHVNKRAGVNRGSKVLIIGAGTIGSVVGLCAQEMGAGIVAVSEINPDRLAHAQELGFCTINAANEDVVQRAKELTGGDGFDIVIEASGSKSGVMMMTDVCRTGGTLMALSLSALPYEFPIGKVSFREMTLIGSRLYSQQDFENGVKLLTELARSRDLSSLISDIMPLDELPLALEKAKSGQCVGKILINCM